MYTINHFESAKSSPPKRSGYYLAYLENKTIKILFYSLRYGTWTHTNLCGDKALSECFNQNVLAWAPTDTSTSALAIRNWT